MLLRALRLRIRGPKVMQLGMQRQSIGATSINFRSFARISRHTGMMTNTRDTSSEEREHEHGMHEKPSAMMSEDQWDEEDNSQDWKAVESSDESDSDGEYSEDWSEEEATPNEIIEDMRHSNPYNVIANVRGGEQLHVGDLNNFEADCTESFIRGGGNGGQKVNKTNNCVQLRHVPTGITVKCHAQRHLEDNRRIARKIMQQKLEELYLGKDSRIQRKYAKKRKRKAKSKARARAKYGDAKKKKEDE